MPEYVLLEFRGTALRWIRSESRRLDEVWKVGREWARSEKFAQPAADLRAAAEDVALKLKTLPTEVESVIRQIRDVADVSPHTQDLHFRGDLRFLAGHPPDVPADGLKDCRIYETIHDIARRDQANPRARFFVTKDADFDDPALVAELDALGFKLRKDPGRLYSELKR